MPSKKRCINVDATSHARPFQTYKNDKPFSHHMRRLLTNKESIAPIFKTETTFKDLKLLHFGGFNVRTCTLKAAAYDMEKKISTLIVYILCCTKMCIMCVIDLIIMDCYLQQ